MFVSKEEIFRNTGQTVDNTILSLAQLMVETYVGKSEEEVDSGSDMAILARATTFQAVYIKENPASVLEQAALKQIGQNESVVTFDTDKFSPFMSPWAMRACERLSWAGTRSVKTGSMRRAEKHDWVWEWTHL